MGTGAPWIMTYTGRKFYPLDPRTEDISILDIAHALSLICRYVGHTRVFYSVAEHSVRLSDIVSEEHKLAGLLHDSPEAYLTDMPSQVKHIMPGMVEAEERLLKMIFIRYEIGLSIPEEVKQADHGALLTTEVRDLMASSDDWCLVEPPLEDVIIPWNSYEAEIAFLGRFIALADMRGSWPYYRPVVE